MNKSLDINSIISKYLELRSLRDKVDSQLNSAEAQLVDYCLENKKRTISYKDMIISVIHKDKSVFPSKSDPRRKELEKVLASFSITSQYKTIDITRLASAYDSKKLPSDLSSALAPLAVSKPYIRISLFPQSQKP